MRIFTANHAENATIYIRLSKDWPAYRWTDSDLPDRLAAVRHRQGRLLGRLEAFGFELRTEAVFRTLTEDVLKTSEIEGDVLDEAQVRSSLARRLGLEIGGLAAVDRHVEGVVEMVLDATRIYRDPLTADRLFGWHAALFPTGRSGLSEIVVGRWRDDADGPMRVLSGAFGRERVHFEAPAAERLPSETSAFLEWFNRPDDLDPVMKAAVAHLWFVTIHPFADGNGRIARAIADMQLARSEGSPQRFYSMSAQIRHARADYYAILEATQKGDLDISDWLHWFLDCLDRAFAHAEMTLGLVLAKARFWEALGGAPLNERQRTMLNRLLDGFEGKLTSSKWAKLTKVSPDSALRDINDLVARGILVKGVAGGRGVSYALAPFGSEREQASPND